MSHFAGSPTALTADTVDLTSDDLRYLLRVTQGLWDGLTYRGTDTTVPGLAGQIPRNRVALNRIVVAEGHVLPTGADEDAIRADLLAIRQEVDQLMRSDQDPYVLEVTLEDGSTATINARPLRAEWGDDKIPTYRTLALYWLSVDPDWVFV